MEMNTVHQSIQESSLRKRVFLNIMYAQNQLVESMIEVLKHHDLSIEQYYVLNILKKQKGKAANMCVIQESMISKASNTTRLVDKLLLKNYVIREVCSKNRRKIDVFITQTGLNILDIINPLIEILEEKFAKNLNVNELEELNSLLEKYRS